MSPSIQRTVLAWILRRPDEQIGQWATDDVLDERGGRRISDQLRRHPPSIAEHSDAVRDAEHLVEPMADVDDAEAFGAEAAEHAEEPGHVGLRQRRCRLVKD